MHPQIGGVFPRRTLSALSRKRETNSYDHRRQNRYYRNFFHKKHLRIDTEVIDL